MSYVLATLVCGHEKDVSIHEVQVVSAFCHECHTKRGIVDVVTSEWYSYCYDCRHRKYWGENKDLAQAAATKHWRTKNNHRAFIARGSRPKSIEARKFLIKRGIITGCG